jgi:hypothetical protein
MSITGWRWNGALGGWIGNGNASWNNSIQLNQNTHIFSKPLLYSHFFSNESIRISHMRWRVNMNWKF